MLIGFRRPLMLYSVAETLGVGMRVSDRVLKCALFLGVMDDKRFVPVGTAFIVQHQEEEYFYQYIVTCQHNVISAGTRPLHIRVNEKSGGAEVSEEIQPDAWLYHPDSAKRFVDIAVMPATLPIDVFDIAHIVSKDLWSREKIAERDIGVGEELFYPGLFLHHSGAARNLPVMRSGTLAAMPIEPVETARGPTTAYLMESRSIGGHSGSPVFANLLAPRSYYADKVLPLPLPHEDQRYPMLGVLRSYFKTVDEGLSSNAASDDLSLNSGISTIIPSWEITDILNQPKQVEMRKRLNAELRASRTAEVEASAVPATDNPSHKEDFTRLLGAAVQAKSQAE
ncbi:MAG: hypothetical protein H0U98_16985 [Alphaproteobacteria bacterium]|nr:hypothetical protein [Alphaproteobacteria bacterium]